MDNSVLRWFQQKGGFHFFQRGSQLAMKALQKVLGSAFLDQLALFLNDLEGMQSGFKARHLAVLELFKNPTTSFVLVTQASEARFLESVEFHKVLQSEGIRLDQLILNRMETTAHERHTPGLSRESLEWITAFARYLHELQLIQKKWMDAFKTALPVPTVLIPRNSKSLTNLETLLELGNSLTCSAS
ncbi:MAG: hypothetical protein EBZ49_13220 [Proteobacteria bacterium]|nr:hypothetical protein [Pseudomonadota bacterium]